MAIFSIVCTTSSGIDQIFMFSKYFFSFRLLKINGMVPLKAIFTMDAIIILRKSRINYTSIPYYAKMLDNKLKFFFIHLIIRISHKSSSSE